MAFQLGVSVALSTADQLTLKNYVNAQKAVGKPFNGMTDTQIANALNAPTQIQNPAPQGTITQAMSKAGMLTQIANAAINASAAGPSGAALLATLEVLQSSVSSISTDPIPAATILQWAADFTTESPGVSAGLIAYCTTPDPSYPPTVNLSPWAYYALSVPSQLVAGDILTATGS
jgi:hypothetical protein